MLESSTQGDSDCLQLAEISLCCNSPSTESQRCSEWEIQLVVHGSEESLIPTANGDQSIHAGVNTQLRTKWPAHDHRSVLQNHRGFAEPMQRQGSQGE